MSTAVSQKTFDDIVREAHAERARVISELFVAAILGLCHVANGAATLAARGLRSVLQSNEDAYLDGSTSRFDRKRRLLILRDRQAQVALDVGH